MMELIARPGWKKILNNFGYGMTHVVLEKKIKQEEQEWVLEEEVAEAEHK